MIFDLPPSWAVPGQKVVCIKVGPWKLAAGVPRAEAEPRFGEVVTISDVLVNPTEGWCGLTLAEYHPHAIWDVDKFRPVVDDDIEAELFRHRTILEVV